MPSALTRAQIKSRALRLAFPGGIGLPEGAPPDPFTLNEALDEVGDEIMATVEEAYLFFSIDVASGQARYCLPPLLQIWGAYLTPPVAVSNYPINLYVRKAEEFAISFPDYLTAPATGTPSYLVTEGQSSILLYATPDYTQAAGLTPYGIGLWDNTAWSADSAVCPLPRRQHMCLVHGLAYRLATDPAVRQREWGEFMYLKGRIAGEMSDLVTAQRSRAQGTAGWYPAGPLNL